MSSLKIEVSTCLTVLVDFTDGLISFFITTVAGVSAKMSVFISAKMSVLSSKMLSTGGNAAPFAPPGADLAAGENKSA